MAKRRYWLRGVIVAVMLVVGWVLVISYRQIERGRRIEQEVSALQSEADRIRQENETLGEKVAYFASPAFQEQEAKDKLGLKRPDENVAVIKPRPEAGNQDGAVSPERQPFPASEAGTPNYLKWWQSFFPSR